MSHIKLFLLLIALSAISSLTAASNGRSYVKLSDSQIKKNSLIQDLLNYGVDEVLSELEDDDQISDADDFKIIDIQRVYRRKEDRNQKVYYRFEVEVADKKDDIYIQTNFTVEYIPRSNKKDVLKGFTYDIDRLKNEDCEDDKDYQDVPASQWDSSLIEKLLTYGSEYVLKKAAKKGDVSPKDDFDVDVINCIRKKKTKDATYYSFDVELEDDDDNHGYKNNDVRVKATFEVKYKPRSGNKEVTSYDYDVVKCN